MNQSLIQFLFWQEQNENLLLSPAQYNSVVNASLPNCHSSSFLRTSRYASKFSNCKSSHQAPVIDSDNNIIGSKLLKPHPLRISKYVPASPYRLEFASFELKMDVFLCFGMIYVLCPVFFMFALFWHWLVSGARTSLHQITSVTHHASHTANGTILLMEVRHQRYCQTFVVVLWVSSSLLISS